MNFRIFWAIKTLTRAILYHVTSRGVDPLWAGGSSPDAKLVDREYIVDAENRLFITPASRCPAGLPSLQAPVQSSPSPLLLFSSWLFCRRASCVKGATTIRSDLEEAVLRIILSSVVFTDVLEVVLVIVVVVVVSVATSAARWTTGECISLRSVCVQGIDQTIQVSEQRQRGRECQLWSAVGGSYNI